MERLEGAVSLHHPSPLVLRVSHWHPRLGVTGGWGGTAFTAALKKPVIHDLSKSWDWPVGGVGLSCVCFIGAVKLCMTLPLPEVGNTAGNRRWGDLGPGGGV